MLLRSRPQHKRLFFQGIKYHKVNCEENLKSHMATFLSLPQNRLVPAKLRHTGKCASTVTLSCSRNGQKSFGSLKNTLFVHRDSINIYPCPQFTVLWSKGLLRRHLILNLRVRKEHHIVRSAGPRL